MTQHTTDETFEISGMTCINCEHRIKARLSELKGVHAVSVSYRRGSAQVSFDPQKTERAHIIRAIEEIGYAAGSCAHTGSTGHTGNVAGIFVILFAVYMLMRRLGLLSLFYVFPQAEAGVSYGMLFVIGLMTSVHCVAMCGGINLSQCIPSGSGAPDKAGALLPSLLYNFGRVISYTVVGAAVGALGSIISFSGPAKGAVQLAAGIFMVIMGVNMLGVFPWLRKFTPRLPAFCPTGKTRQNGPLVIGLLNGLMPCGPLQAMQLYALSTGSPFKGALSMFLFSLGTVPLMFGLGALSTLLSKKFTGKMMTAGAVLVVVLGVSMFNSGLALSGFTATSASTGEGAAQVENGVQVINTQLSSGRYAPITVVSGIPVRWTITAAPGTVNGCNNRILIPEYGIEKRLEVGENVIEFTPARSGTFPYSCWMGMIRSSITVTESDGSTAAPPAQEDAYPYGGLFYPGTSSPVPRPAGYEIPADAIAIAEIREDRSQYVSIDMTDDRFSPAVVVLQYGLETEWVINNAGNRTGTLVFPLYYAELELAEGENFVYLAPTETFDFSSGDNTFYGYVKVVDDINDIDTAAIQKEVLEYVPYIANFNAAGGSRPAACH